MGDGVGLCDGDLVGDGVCVDEADGVVAVGNKCEIIRKTNIE